MIRSVNSSSALSLRYRLEYALFFIGDQVLSWLPMSLLWTLGEALGSLFFLLDARHRRVVRCNLTQSDLSLSPERLKYLSRHAFTHFGGFFLSLIKLRHENKEEILRRVDVEGLEHFDACQAAGKGFIQLTGHYGHWEIIALAQSALGRSLSVIGRELDNPFLEKVSAGFRTRFGNEVILKDGALRESVRALKAGKGIGFLLDQNAGEQGIWVRFLGQWASTYPSAGALVSKFDIPILPVFSWIQDDGRFKIQFQKPIHVPLTGDTDRDIWKTTQVMTHLIEAQIHRDPSGWFWLHNRFKTQPDPLNSRLHSLPRPEWVE